jgi:hypothetical protein
MWRPTRTRPRPPSPTPLPDSDAPDLPHWFARTGQAGAVSQACFSLVGRSFAREGAFVTASRRHGDVRDCWRSHGSRCERRQEPELSVYDSLHDRTPGTDSRATSSRTQGSASADGWHVPAAGRDLSRHATAVLCAVRSAARRDLRDHRSERVATTGLPRQSEASHLGRARGATHGEVGYE